MAINKNGTGYTFVFAVAMVVVVGAAYCDFHFLKAQTASECRG